MFITPLYLDPQTKRRPGLPIKKVEFLVAHDTGNPGSTARNNVKYYKATQNKQKVSAHIFADDKEIIECIPALTAKPEKAWHVRYNIRKDNEIFGSDANDSAIGVEYCYGQGIDSQKAYANYVWIMAKLCQTFNLSPDRIIGHHLLDPQRRKDPLTGLKYSRKTYPGFLKDIGEELENLRAGENQERLIF